MLHLMTPTAAVLQILLPAAPVTPVQKTVTGDNRVVFFISSFVTKRELFKTVKHAYFCIYVFSVEN